MDAAAAPIESQELAATTAAATLATPAVHAVIVAHDPAEWFEDVLAAWASQSYAPLGITVVDNGSEAPVEPRVAEALPSARVVRLDRPTGYPAAVAAGLAARPGEGGAAFPEPGFLVLAHDDAAPAPNTVEVLVQEALAVEASMVGPKLVHWDRPDALEDLGLRVDLFGAPVHVVERGELDQAQHDSLGDVFGITGPFMLVRAETYHEVGGLDQSFDFVGDDVDLAWRVQAAGGRVRVAPDAVVRHVSARATRRSVAEDERRTARHQLRAALADHGIANLVLVVPQLMVLSFAEAAYALGTGRVDRFRTVIGAWLWNLRRLPSLLRRRRSLHHVRRISDAELRFAQVPPKPRWRVFVDQTTTADEPERDPLASMRSAPVRFGVGAWMVALLVVVLGSRGLLFGEVPAIGHLQPLPPSPGHMVAEWWTGWRDAGLGHAGPAPFGVALLGAAGWLLDTVRLDDTFHTFLVLGLVLVGLRGAWRAGAWMGPGRPQAAVLLTYALLPVAFNAISAGRLDGLVVWTAAPWILLRLMRVQAAPPVPRTEASGSRPLVYDTLLLGGVVALACAVAPVAAIASAAIAVGLGVGSVVAGRLSGLHRLVAGSIGAAAVAGLLHLPYLIELVDAGEWAPVAGGADRRGGLLSFVELLRLDTGPFGGSWVSWATLAVGAGGLLVGRGWRFAWCVRGWFVALAGWSVAWVFQRGWLDLGSPAPEVGTAVAAVGVALAAGASVASYDEDLRRAVEEGRARLAQLVPVGTVAALVLLFVPAAGAALDGRWDLPPKDLRDALSFLEEPDAGEYRVLWVGHPDILPVRGWPLGDGVAYGTSENGLASMADQWIPPEGEDTRQLADAVRRAAGASTTRLGAELAPMAVRYVVVVNRPGIYGVPDQPIPAPYADGLGAQLDLQLVAGTTSAVTVYRNLAWVPGIADLNTAADQGSGGDAVDLRRATPALERADGYTRHRGGIAERTTLFHSVSRDDGWRLTVDGQEAKPLPALGWAQRFEVPTTGEGVLSFSPGSAHRLGTIAQIVGFGGLFLLLGSWRTKLERSR